MTAPGEPNSQADPLSESAPDAARPREEALARLESLENLVLMMPRMLQMLDVVWRQPELPPDIKRLSGYVRTYLWHPDDFLPDREGYLLGYADDAYLAASVLVRAVDLLPAEHALKTRQYWAFVQDIRRLKGVAVEAIPRQAQRVDTMVDQLLEGNPREFLSLFKPGPRRQG